MGLQCIIIFLFFGLGKNAPSPKIFCSIASVPIPSSRTIFYCQLTSLSSSACLFTLFLAIGQNSIYSLCSSRNELFFHLSPLVYIFAALNVKEDSRGPQQQPNRNLTVYAPIVFISNVSSATVSNVVYIYCMMNRQC